MPRWQDQVRSSSVVCIIAKRDLVMDYVADPNALMADINTLKILLMFLMIGSLLGFVMVLKKLQA